MLFAVELHLLPTLDGAARVRFLFFRFGEHARIPEAHGEGTALEEGMERTSATIA
jgi:hypothetical protein